MEKKERRIVFGIGLVLLLIFTFTDLQISLAIAKKPAFARVLEVVGEIPFTILTLAGCGMIVRFRNRESVVKKTAAVIGGGVLFGLFSLMGGFMTWNYLSDNLGEVSKVWIPLIGLLMAGTAIWITMQVPAGKRDQALRYAAAALIYFLLVLIVMNSLKTVWGRMRFREMTDPVNEFTRWYQICGRGSFDNAYASFPSGHSMNSAGVILMLLLPEIIPFLQEKKKLLRVITYVWCVCVGASRVFMGAHFASDVTVGILLSFALFDLVSMLIYKETEELNLSEQRWRRKEEDGYVLIENENGQTLGISADSRVKILTVDGYAFKDFLGTGELVPYEDWRLPYEERAKDLAERLEIEDITGLMLYSAHQLIPAKGPMAAVFGGTYGGKSYEESGAKPWDLTDQQKEFIEKDKVRHVLIMGLESTEAAVRWNNKLQALAENTGFGIPANNSSDPRHGAGSAAEYMGVTGEPISKWANGIGLSASFDPALVKEFGEMGSAEYRALGITTALSPQIDLATEPRWMRFADTFGEHTQMTIDMTKAYCDGFQTTEGTKDGWGMDSVNTMVKHFPGGGSGEGGRDAHYAYGKYAVYPGENFGEHLKPFTQGAFALDGKTKKAGAVMPYYTISYGVDQKYGENVGNSYSRYLIRDLLREELGYDGVVCTDWGITHDIGATEEEFAGKCWGVEGLTEGERHFKALEAGVDQFGGNNDAAPVLEAYSMACEKYGKEAADARFRRSAYRLLLNIFRTGLFENPYLDLRESENTVGCEEFKKKGYESQLKSITMLKNKGNILPLKEGIRLYVPPRQSRSYLDFMSKPTGDREIVPAGKQAAAKYFTVVDTPEEADAALCFMESPISVGYSPEDRKAGGNGYVPVTLQYRPYQAESARAESLAGGDPLEESKNCGYKNKCTTAANEADLDNVLQMREIMGEKPVIAVVSLKNPMVMAEFEPYADVLLVEYGVTPEAVMDVLAGKFEPQGLLPVQMPKDMKTVECQKEDVAFDMECYVDSEGHTYDFGYGMSYAGVISDERTRRYAR